MHLYLVRSKGAITVTLPSFPSVYHIELRAFAEQTHLDILGNIYVYSQRRRHCRAVSGHLQSLQLVYTFVEHAER